jgi:anion-transporting  ArsA/GET3 family ATPase
MPAGELLETPLLLVSGKGGTGKTAVATAIALAAARGGRRTLLVDAEGRSSAAALLGEPPPGFRERPTPLGFSMLSIDPRRALLEYVRLFFGMRGLARPLEAAGVARMATEAIPGFRDLMIAGKLYELTEWRASSVEGRRRARYELVVVDAPPTGQLLPLLRGPSAYLDLIRAGRAHDQLRSIDGMLRSRCRVALVTVPEELAVAETLEAAASLRSSSFSDPLLLVNRVAPPVFPRGTRAAASRLSAPSISTALEAQGVLVEERLGAEMRVIAIDEDRRVRAERTHIAALARLGPVLELPFIPAASFGVREVETLSRHIA